MSSANEEETKYIISRLRRAIREHHFCILTGAGVSTAIAQLSGWSELLEKAIKFGEHKFLNADMIEDARYNVQREPLLAGVIIKKMFAQGGNQLFSSWLDMTFGSEYLTLSPEAPKLLDILRKIHTSNPHIKFATTNYDTVLDESLEMIPLAWNESYNVRHFLHDEVYAAKRMLHLHGVYTDASHMIFSSDDYAKQIASPSSRHVTDPLKTLLDHYTVLFIGCGGTTTDPHFTWVFDKLYREGAADHVLLYHRSHSDRKPGPSHNRIYSYSHGEYKELPATLRTILPDIFAGDPPGNVAQSVTGTPPIITSPDQMVPSRRSTNAAVTSTPSPPPMPSNARTSPNQRSRSPTNHDMLVSTHDHDRTLNSNLDENLTFGPYPRTESLAQLLDQAKCDIDPANCKEPQQFEHVLSLIDQVAQIGHFGFDPVTGKTLLHYLAMNGLWEWMLPMVRHGADVNASDGEGFTPLHLAIVGNHAKTVEVLIKECGANATYHTRAGRVPWTLALATRLHFSDPPDKRKAQFIARTNIIKILAKSTPLDCIRNSDEKGLLERIQKSQLDATNTEPGPVQTILETEQIMRSSDGELAPSVIQELHRRGE